MIIIRGILWNNLENYFLFYGTAFRCRGVRLSQRVIFGHPHVFTRFCFFTRFPITRTNSVLDSPTTCVITRFPRHETCNYTLSVHKTCNYTFNQGSETVSE